ncbi:MAG TPA: alpha/beta hydrolase [Nitriliruptorales bacterium]|nr:alpha/beta hydrolase [Nitriliruptorales bacterium]
MWGTVSCVELVSRGSGQGRWPSESHQERGSGPALVLLHGWPLDSREWWRQLDGLSDEFRVVAWDAPGAGQSSGPPETSRLPRLGPLAGRVHRGPDLAAAHVAGLSVGGGLPLELFRQHPEVVRSLILISAYAGLGRLPPCPGGPATA